MEWARDPEKQSQDRPDMDQCSDKNDSYDPLCSDNFPVLLLRNSTVSSVLFTLRHAISDAWE